MMNFRRTATCFATVLLVGCATPIDSVRNADEVGQVFVKAFPPIPFEQIQKDLEQATLKLTPDEAVARAIAITTVQNTAVSTANKVNAQVGLPVRQRTSSNETQITATSNEPSKSTSTSTTTTTVSSPTLPGTPSLEVPPAEASTAASQPVVADSRLQQIIAMGLLEENVWLNNRLKHFKPLKHQRAFLMTFQVSVHPNVHGLPVNSVVDISLWPRERSQEPSASKSPSVTVLPILMTDNLEASAHNARVSRSREIGASLQGGNIGFLAALSFSHASNKYAETIGHQLNGVSVVGFKNNNRVVVRMGASRSPGTPGGLALTSRSHLLSILVLADNDIESLDAIARSHFVDQTTNEVICDGSDEKTHKGA